MKYSYCFVSSFTVRKFLFLVGLLLLPVLHTIQALKESFDHLRSSSTSSFGIENRIVFPNSFPHIISINVVYLDDDFAADGTLCDPQSSTVSMNMCNLRSAWLFCNDLMNPSILCDIELPHSGYLYFNRTIGPLTMDPSSNIYIGGNGAIIDCVESAEPFDEKTVYYYYGYGSGTYKEQFLMYVNHAFPPSPPPHIPYLYLTQFTLQNFFADVEAFSPIYVDGYMNLTIDSCNFINNVAVSGGSIAILQNPSYSVLINNIFQGNQAEYGGSISLSQNMNYVLLSGNTFLNSFSSHGGGSLYIGKQCSHISIQNSSFQNSLSYDFGGAIYIQSSTKLIAIRNTRFEHCGSPRKNGLGGAIYMISGAHIAIDSSQFINLFALKQGAAILNDDDGHISTDVSITNSVFKINYANVGGGAIAILPSTTNLLIRLNQFIEAGVNETKGGGGAILIGNQISNSILDANYFSNCTALIGGAILFFKVNTNISITNSTFKNGYARAYGGSIGFGPSATTSNVLIQNNQFIQNQVNPFAGYGGSISFLGPINSGMMNSNYFHKSAAYAGGAIFVAAASKDLFIQNSTFKNCNALANGGSIYLKSGNNNINIVNSHFYNTFAGHLSGGGGAIYIHTANTKISIVDCLFNQSVGAKFGGSVYVGSSNQYVYILHSVCLNAHAQGGGCYYFDQDSQYIFIENNYFANTISDSDGGAIVFYYNIAHVHVSNTFITNSYAASSGGAIISQLNTRDIVFENISITNSVAGQGGGCICVSNNASFVGYRLQLNNCVSQSAAGGGGGIQCDNNVLFQLHDSSIENCKTIGIGGGISFANSNGLLINNTRISSNAAVLGGGIFIDENVNNMHIINSIVDKNNASQYGGGLYLRSMNNNFILAGTILENNFAQDSGGGIYIQQQNYQLSMMSFEGYQAYQVLESQHPYTATYPVNGIQQVIYFQKVYVPNAIGFVLNFDTQSSIESSCTLQIYNCYSNVTYLLVDGNQWPGYNLPSLTLFEKNSFCIKFLGPPNNIFNLVNGYYGFKLYTYPVLANPKHPTILRMNSVASYGGGFLSFFNNVATVFVNCIFEENRSLNADGGGAYFQIGNSIVTMYGVLFRKNFASYNGGGLVLLSGNFGVKILLSEFSQNYNEKGNGGGLYIGTGNGNGVLLANNQVVIERNVTFNLNHAAVSGGAIYSSSQNFVVFQRSIVIVSNTAAYTGGGICLDYLNSIHCDSVILRNNTATNGGGLISNSANTLSLTNVYFENNYATSGGGMLIEGATSLTVTKNFKFINNRAKVAGGGMIIYQSSFWTRDMNDTSSSASYQNMTIFEGNQAPKGSAILLYQLIAASTAPTTNNSHGGQYTIVFDSNEAFIGGTVYWTYDSVMTSPPAQLTLAPVLWVNNKAPYGMTYGTQAIQILTPIEYNATVYSSPLTPAITMYMLDYYHQLIPITGETTVSVSISDSECNIHPYLAGDDLSGAGVSFVNGSASFSQLIAYCSPKGNFVLQFTAALGSLSIGSTATATKAESYYISNTTNVHFRDCLQGEYLVDGVCAPCPLSTFSLFPDYLQTQCTSCMSTEGVDSCESNQIMVSAGYWRRHFTSAAVMQCPLSSDSCIGGNITGQALCSGGYEGPLCAVCSDGYFLNDDQECVSCSTENKMSPLAIVIITAAFLGFSFAVAYFFTDITFIKKMVDDYVLYYYEKFDAYNEFSDRCKIIISTFQIIIPSAFIFNVTYPKVFNQFCNALSFMNFNILTLFSVSCATGYNYMDTLLWTTLTPIMIVIFLIVSWGMRVGLLLYSHMIVDPITRAEKRMSVQQRLEKIYTEKYYRERKYHEITVQHLNYIFYLTYLVLPSVTTTIFQVFLCTNIDPDQEDSDQYDLYLTADMSISCQNSYYYQWVTYAVFMIFVYPIGIPCLYLYLLYVNQKEISERKVKTEDDEEEEEEEENGEEKEEGSQKDNEEPIEKAVGVLVHDGKIGWDDEVIESHSHDKESHQNERPKNDANDEPEKSALHQRRRSSEKSVDKKKSKERTNSLIKEGKSPDESNPDETRRASENSSSPKKPPGKLSDSAERLSFLWSSYSPRYWYWEIIETTRRIMLTAVLSICAPGTSQQSVLAVLLALLYIKVYASYAPYLEVSNSVLAEIGQLQIFFTYFTALIIQNALLDSNWNTFLGFFLAISNLSVVVYPMIEDSGIKVNDIKKFWVTLRTSGIRATIKIYLCTPKSKKKDEEDKNNQDEHGEAIDKSEETTGRSVLATVMSPFFKTEINKIDNNHRTDEKGDIELAIIGSGTASKEESIESPNVEK